MSECLSTGWGFFTSRDPFGQVSIGNLKLRVSFSNTELPPCVALCHRHWDFYGFWRGNRNQGAERFARDILIHCCVAAPRQFWRCQCRTDTEPIALCSYLFILVHSPPPNISPTDRGIVKRSSSALPPGQAKNCHVPLADACA